MFSEEQLKLIQQSARKVKNQGELAVLDRLVADYNKDKTTAFGTFNARQMKVLRFCAQECKRQGSGEMSVYWMVNAWAFASTYMLAGKYRSIDLHFIEALGQWTEPHKNLRGFRRQRIFVGNRFEMHEKAPWERVPELLTHLIDAYYTGAFTEVGDEHYWRMHPAARSAEDEFYYEYESIHPFVDGNGRTGKIIYNYLLGRLDDPIMPPNFWGSSNP
jgi:hypothetical protein